MFNEQVGGQVAWLLPLAAVEPARRPVADPRRAPRTDRRRAAWVLFGVWALVHVAVFSSQQGIFHPYYVSALAPAVAALCGAGVVTLWRWARTSWAGLIALDAAARRRRAGSRSSCSGRTPDFAPWLRTAIRDRASRVALFASLALRMPEPVGRRMLAVAAVAGALALTAGPGGLQRREPRARAERQRRHRGPVRRPASAAACRAAATAASATS